MERVEIEEAIGEVARKHNLLLSPDDPLLVTITLNEVILRRVLERQRQAIEAAQDQISAGAAQQIEAAKQVAGIIVTGAADYLTGEFRQAAEILKTELVAVMQGEERKALRAAEAASQAKRLAWAAALAALGIAGMLIIALGVLLPQPYCQPGSAPSVRASAALAHQPSPASP
jgi:hypothetical protein